MTESCERTRTALAFGATLDSESARHLAGCDDCRAEASALRTVARSLAAGRAALPPSGLAARVHAAAAPVLARHQHAALWRTVGRAVAAAALPLPLVLLVDAWLLRTVYEALHAVLPQALSVYFVVNYVALLAVLLTLAYGAIPFLVERQTRLQSEERYG